MSLGTLIELLTLTIALTGLLLQTRRDPSAPPSWRNLSRGGRLVLVVLVVLASVKIYKGQIDSAAQRKASEAGAKRFTELQASNEDLLSTNKHLIKVMSVASGYNALLSGMVVFKEVPTQKIVEEVLRNIFLKYAEVEISASNRLGKYIGRMDYGAHPELRRYLNAQRIQDDPELKRIRDLVPEPQWSRAFYYEIRCASLKILNRENIQYARFDPLERIEVRARVFDWWRDFRSLYGVDILYIDKLTIEELGDTPIEMRF